MTDGCRETADYVDTRWTKHRYKCPDGHVTSRDTSMARRLVVVKYVAMAAGAGLAVVAGPTVATAEVTGELGKVVCKGTKKGIKCACKKVASDPQATLEWGQWACTATRDGVKCAAKKVLKKVTGTP